MTNVSLLSDGIIVYWYSRMDIIMRTKNGIHNKKNGKTSPVEYQGAIHAKLL